MKIAEWRSIIEDIESKLDAGEGYTLDLRTESGAWMNIAWAPIRHTSRFGNSVIVLSQGDCPPTYLSVASIESVQLNG